MFEDGRLKLDTRGFQKLSFVRGCVSGGRLTSGECACAFESARAQGELPDGGPYTAAEIEAMRGDAVRCADGPIAKTS